MLLQHCTLVLPFIGNQESQQTPVLGHHQLGPTRSLEITVIQVDKQVTCTLVGATPGVSGRLTILGIGQLYRLPESSHRQLSLLIRSACGAVMGMIDSLFV